VLLSKIEQSDDKEINNTNPFIYINVMGTLEKILNMLKTKNKPKSYGVKFYAEMKLDDGRVVATEDEQFMIGSKVFAVSDDGNAEALEAGSYTMENGNKLTIGENSEILDLGEEAESVEEEASVEEELAEESTEEELAEDDEADVEDWAGMEKRIKNLEDAVADLKADKVEASAEMSEEVEVEEEEKTEMSKEVMGELITQIEELKGKIVELSGEPADEGITYSPEGSNVNTTMDLKGLSIDERTAYYINNK
tara:strand:- start:722 stop:1477 length:756 start_codon:yes stop_codon:yes gene_type:complete